LCLSGRMKVVLCTRFCSKAYTANIQKQLDGFSKEETWYSYSTNLEEATEHFYYIMVNYLNEKECIVQLRFSTAPRIRYMVPISQLREHLLRLETCELPFLRAA
jgi:hypothetical protein